MFFYKMPKGNKLHITYTKVSYFCSVKNTDKYFATEKDRDSYLKRHSKMCICKGISQEEELTIHNTSNGINTIIRNDLSING